MLAGGQEVIIGAVTDPAFGKLVAFGLGGMLVEVLKDITFRLAPASREDALSMLDGIAAAEILQRRARRGAGGSRGARHHDRARRRSWSATFPEISELDLNPVFATEGRDRRRRARRARLQAAAPARYRPEPGEPSCGR